MQDEEETTNLIDLQQINQEVINNPYILKKNAMNFNNKLLKYKDFYDFVEMMKYANKRNYLEIIGIKEFNKYFETPDEELTPHSSLYMWVG